MYILIWIGVCFYAVKVAPDSLNQLRATDFGRTIFFANNKTSHLHGVLLCIYANHVLSTSNLS